jgi:hypothetical protein
MFTVAAVIVLARSETTKAATWPANNQPICFALDARGAIR